MNKKPILLMVAAVFALNANAQGKYTINGNLQNAEGKTIYLSTGDFGATETDSATITNGKFTFSGEMNTPFKSGTLILGSLTDYHHAKFWQVAMEPLTISVEGDAKQDKAVVIKAGKVQEELNCMAKEMSVFEKPMRQLSDALYAQQTKEGRDAKLDAQIEQLLNAK